MFCFYCLVLKTRVGENEKSWLKCVLHSKFVVASKSTEFDVCLMGRKQAS